MPSNLPPLGCLAMPRNVDDRSLSGYRAAWRRFVSALRRPEARPREGSPPLSLEGLE